MRIERAITASRELADPTSPHWWWWWEIGAMFISVFCMASVVIILAQIDDLPLDSWLLPIQTNSLIAVLTTIAKTSMLVAGAGCLSQLKWRHFRNGNQRLYDMQLFDDASRGPWGSFMFLGSIRSSAMVFGYFLSFATIAALGIEPSTQQVLKLETRNTRLPNARPVLGVADEYLSRAFFDIYYGTPSHQYAEDVDLYSAGEDFSPSYDDSYLQLGAALLNGALGYLSKPEFSCPAEASTCSWPVFSTMALCSKFQNVTELVKSNCTEPSPRPPVKNNDNNVTVTEHYKACDFYFPPSDMNQNPNPLEVRWSWPEETFLNGTKVNFQPRMYFLRSSVTIIQDSIGGSSGSLAVVRIPNREVPWKVGDPVHIYQSTWYWCEKTFSGVTASQGVLNEGTLLKVTPLVPYKKITSTHTTLIYRTNSTTPREYSMRATTPANLFWYLSGMLQNDFVMYTTSGGPSFATRGPRAKVPLSLGSQLDSDNLENITANIAATISTMIRSDNPGDNANLTFVSGDAITKETYFHVRWSWLTLPLSITILVTASLGATILTTRDIPLYKGSVLALIRQRVDGLEEGEHQEHIMDLSPITILPIYYERSRLELPRIKRFKSKDFANYELRAVNVRDSGP
ncbi:hypothetical protein QBC43DRAFT_287649 [Cladorrhinum sp. PSN259]|nr:hypothetical protein QBC43DRAFT_287649 [Cladorrhinum sp. PSN259]